MILDYFFIGLNMKLDLLYSKLEKVKKKKKIQNRGTNKKQPLL